MSPSKRAQLAVFTTVFVDLLGFGILIPILPLYAKSLAVHPTPWMAWINQTLGLGDPGVFWAGATMVLFSLAERIEAASLDRARNAIHGLLQLTPPAATIRAGDGAWTQVAAQAASPRGSSPASPISAQNRRGTATTISSPRCWRAKANPCRAAGPWTFSGR